MLKKYQLRNGLNVILYPSQKAPVISTQIWVNTGSADETKGIEGVSHFIEHLVFKGSEKYEVGEIAKKVEASGGQLNAYTSFDQTVFYITLSNEFSETALDMLSQMMGYPKFDKEEIDNEREVVIEEIKRSNDSLGRVASQAMFSNVYKKHPYGRPVIGYDKVIKKIPKKKIVDYYKSHYSANNMTLLVVGDFEINDMKGMVKQYFSEIPSHKTKKVKREKEPVQEKARIKTLKTNFNETRMSISWPTTTALHKDTLALDVLAGVLGQYETSKLIHRLRVEDPCVNYVYASSFTPKNKGMFSIHLGLEEEDYERASQLLLEELEKFLQGSVTSEDIARAVKCFENEDIYSLQTVDGIANHIGQYMFLTGDPMYAKKMIRDLKKIEMSDLLRVFKKYLKPEKASITYLSKSEEDHKKKLRKFLKKYEEVFATKKVNAKNYKKPKHIKSPKLSAKAESRNQVEKVILESGAELYLYENHDAPLFHLQLASHGALRKEEDSNNGISNLLSHTWACGGESVLEPDLSKKLEDYSSSIQSFSGRNTIGLKMTSLSKYQKEMMPLYFDILNKENFTTNIVEREKNIILTGIRNKQDNPSQIAGQLFIKNLFKGHPYERDIEGSEKSLMPITKKDLFSFKEKHLNAHNTKLVAVGSFDRDGLIKDLNQNIRLSKSGWKNELNQLRKIESPVLESKKTEKEQTHIFYGFQGLTYSDQDKYTLMLIDAVLSGQGGRLFLELRDKASLAYTVAPLHMEGVDAGYFASYIACSPDKKDKALRMLKEEFEKIVSVPLQEEELARAKRYLIGKHDISLQKNSSIASSILFDAMYGMPAESFQTFADKVRGLSSQDILSLAQRLFGQNSVTTIVGQV